MIADLVIRVEALVPGAIYGSVDGEITEWFDARPQPSRSAILAVDPAPIKAAAAAQVQADADARTAAKADSTIQFLVTHTPQECYDFVQTNVTNLAQAKEVLGRMAMAISALARRELR